MDLIRRDELQKYLRPFGMEYGQSAVETALRATGIEPTRYQGMPGGKGRISLFDPMVTWVLASVWESNGRRFRGIDQPMERFRKLYRQAVRWDGAPSIPGFAEDEVLGTQLLLMTSPFHGMEPKKIRLVTRKHPDVLQYSVHGRQFLVNVLQAYNNVYGDTIKESSIDPTQAERKSTDQQVREFAQRWVTEAAFWFKADAYNASEEAQR